LGISRKVETGVIDNSKDHQTVGELHCLFDIVNQAGKSFRIFEVFFKNRETVDNSVNIVLVGFGNGKVGVEIDNLTVDANPFVT